MNKKKIEYIVTGILGLLLLIFAIKTVFTLRGSRQREAYSKKAEVSAPDKKGRGFVTLEEKIKSETEDLSWRRDPFFINKYIKRISTGEIGEVEALNLSGIIWDEENPTAVISDQIIKEGESIGKFKVKKINKDSVILIKNGKESKLNIK